MRGTFLKMAFFKMAANAIIKYEKYYISEHLQGVNLREAQEIFFSHVRQVIFQDHESRTLQGLLRDYKRIISNHGHNSLVKSSYLKEILIKEYGQNIGFHERILRRM